MKRFFTIVLALSTVLFSYSCTDDSIKDAAEQDLLTNALLQAGQIKKIYRPEAREQKVDEGILCKSWTFKSEQYYKKSGEQVDNPILPESVNGFHFKKNGTVAISIDIDGRLSGKWMAKNGFLACRVYMGKETDKAYLYEVAEITDNRLVLYDYYYTLLNSPIDQENLYVFRVLEFVK